MVEAAFVYLCGIVKFFLDLRIGFDVEILFWFVHSVEISFTSRVYGFGKDANVSWRTFAAF